MRNASVAATVGRGCRYSDSSRDTGRILGPAVLGRWPRHRRGAAGSSEATPIRAWLFQLAAAALLLQAAACQAAAADTIPAQIAGREVFVPVLVNGRGPYQFIVDTGATETIVTPSTAKDAGVATIPYPGVQKKGRVDRIAAGTAGLTNLNVFLFDPPQALSLRLDEGINYGGILGYTFLSRFETTIDYPRRTVRFRPLASAASTNGFAVPFLLVDRLVHVRGRVNDSGPFTFLFDTGSAEVLLTPPAADRLKIQGTPLPSYPGARLATLGSVAVGGAMVPQIDAIIHRPPGERIAGTTYDGIVGYPFLSRHTVTIRYDKSLIFLEPDASLRAREAPVAHSVSVPSR
jgi:predicted aspartyl protease